MVMSIIYWTYPAVPLCLPQRCVHVCWDSFYVSFHLGFCSCLCVNCSVFLPFFDWLMKCLGCLIFYVLSRLRMLGSTHLSLPSWRIRKCCLRLRNIVVQAFFLMGHLGLRGYVMNLLSFNPLILLVLSPLHLRFLSLFVNVCGFIKFLIAFLLIVKFSWCLLCSTVVKESRAQNLRLAWWTWRRRPPGRWLCF